jgi:hypothetical protein
MSDEATTSERVGFCQDCGRPLNRDEARTVGQGVFCEPCLHARLTASQSAATTAQPSAAGHTAPSTSIVGDAHPWLAGLLGFIPGVGAMFNGQFAKGIAHLVVFAVLVSFAEHLNWVFWWIVWGWIFYMAFEAYHTARARMEGLPLPNAFGFNDIGEKMGFGKGWGTTAQYRPQAPVTPPPATPGTSATTAAAQTAPGTPWMPVNQNPAPTPGANWFESVPPAQSASYTARTGNAPYTAPVPPTPYSTPSTTQQQYVPMPPVPMPMPGSSFPLVAIWLIGLGVLFTLAEWVPMWHVNGATVTAILLGAVAASWFVRRLGYMGGLSYQGPMLHMMRGPMILAVLAVLFLLQGVHAATLGQTWPVILLALGAVLLGERMGVGIHPYPQSYPTQTQNVEPTSVVPPAQTVTTSAEQNNDERDGYSR